MAMQEQFSEAWGQLGATAGGWWGLVSQFPGPGDNANISVVARSKVDCNFPLSLLLGVRHCWNGRSSGLLSWKWWTAIAASCFCILGMKETSVLNTLSFPVWVGHGDPQDLQGGLSALSRAATSFWEAAGNKGREILGLVCFAAQHRSFARCTSFRDELADGHRCF
jgi:hypothetical protein